MANVKKYIVQPYVYESKNVIYDESLNIVKGHMFAAVGDFLIVKVEMVDVEGVSHLYDTNDTGKLHLYYENSENPLYIFDLDSNFETLIDLTTAKIGNYYIKAFIHNEVAGQAFSSAEIKLKVGR
ncbi:MAG: hypothetical protein PHX50_17130 [Massilibacteroides sp.]|nr:hypothetical protein [Massilibacteroides sp.]